MSRTDISGEKLDLLRLQVKDYLTKKRYSHVLAVEEEAESLGRIFLPDSINELRAAALLHDITKRLKVEEQLKLFDEFGIVKCGTEMAAPKLLHAQTAAALIGRDFEDFADERIVSAVRWHTTGRAGMSLFDMLIYLADYIEKTRTFEDCVVLRKYFYDNIEKADSEKDRFQVLYRTMIMSFDMTIGQLIGDAALIDRDTVEARNWFILNICSL